MDNNLKSIAMAVRIFWLRYRIDGYARQLHSIQVQRENDFNAERMLHWQMLTSRSKLGHLVQQPCATSTPTALELEKCGPIEKASIDGAPGNESLRHKVALAVANRRLD